MNKRDLEKQIELLVKDDERNQQTIIKQSEEIERLHSIIKEVREYIEENMKEYGGDIYITCSELLEILDKESK